MPAKNIGLSCLGFGVPFSIYVSKMAVVKAWIKNRPKCRDNKNKQNLLTNNINTSTGEKTNMDIKQWRSKIKNVQEWPWQYPIEAWLLICQSGTLHKNLRIILRICCKEPHQAASPHEQGKKVYSTDNREGEKNIKPVGSMASPTDKKQGDIPHGKQGNLAASSTRTGLKRGHGHWLTTTVLGRLKPNSAAFLSLLHLPSEIKIIFVFILCFQSCQGSIHKPVFFVLLRSSPQRCLWGGGGGVLVGTLITSPNMSFAWKVNGCG